MLIIDNVLLAPLSGIFWVFKEVHKAAEQELATEAELIPRQLGELYLKLETQAITEEEFTVQEKRLLDRLEELRPEEDDGEDSDE